MWQIWISRTVLCAPSLLVDVIRRKAIILGDKEVEENVLTIKILKTQEQVSIKIEELDSLMENIERIRMNRTHHNGTLRMEHVNETVELVGWVSKRETLDHSIY